MEKEEESKRRVMEKKKKIREDLRIVLRGELGLPMYKKVINKSPQLKKYCKLLKIYEKEDEIMRAETANSNATVIAEQEPSAGPSRTSQSSQATDKNPKQA
jgi:hypothetical protein